MLKIPSLDHKISNFLNIKVLNLKSNYQFFECKKLYSLISPALKYFINLIYVDYTIRIVYICISLITFVFYWFIS